jgi:predicted NodU family carbamoyl transferase
VSIGTAYCGRDLNDIDEALAEFAPWIESTTDFAPAQFVEDITDDVIAWVDGRAEIGPRALGHRSLLVTLGR